MDRTFYDDDRQLIPRRASGYSFAGGKTINAPYISMTVPHAAGGLVSTVDDLLRWDNALRNGEIVPKEMLERAWRPAILSDGTSSGYGFGWGLCTLAGHRTIEHGGWINGFGARSIRLPDQDLNIIVLVNNDADRPDASMLARRIARLLLTGNDQFTRHTLTSAEKRSLLGQYRPSSGEVLTISERDGSLYYRIDSNVEKRLVALSQTTLSPAGGDGTYVFRFTIAPGGLAQSIRATLNCQPTWTAERSVSSE